LNPRRARAVALAALVAALPAGGAAAQTFYGCTGQSNCESLSFALSATPNQFGHFFGQLTQTLTVATPPINWFGSNLVFSGPPPLMGACPDCIDSPFSGAFLPLGSAQSYTLVTGAYFAGPTTVTSAIFLLQERPVGAPAGVLTDANVVLTLTAPQAVLPEPATIALVASGLALVGLAVGRRRGARP
jgi:hypothetical protein